MTMTAAPPEDAPTAIAMIPIWRSWLDGIWLLLAANLAALPVLLAIWLMVSAVQWAGGNVLLRTLVTGITFFIGPFILSRAFRALDYPGWPPRRKGD